MANATPYVSTRATPWAAAARALLLVAACGAVAATSAWAAGPRRISTGDPFAGCTADAPAGQAGTLYPDAEVEPSIAVNSSNRLNFIAGWQQDRWSNGGSRGLAAGITTDGGVTWKTVAPPGISKCAGGIYDRASDPWVSIGPAGTAFFMSLAFMRDRPDGAYGANAMLVSRSLDGGSTWSKPIPLITDSDGQITNDKNALIADPRDVRYAYAVWDRLQDFSLPSAARAAAAEDTQGSGGVAAARDRMRMLKARGGSRALTPSFKGPTYFARTIDGGATWQAARNIYDPGDDAQTINNIPLVLPNGALVIAFSNLSNLGATSIGIIKSLDKGLSFGAPALPISTTLTATGTLTPDAKEPVRDANFLFDAAVDRKSGYLYVVWQDGRFGGVDKVAFSMSKNGGATWSLPVRINMTPASTAKLRNQAFVPSVEVGAGGQIVVTYYDFRFDKSDGKELTDYFAVFCTPGAAVNCAQRANWGDGVTAGKDIRLTTTSFDMLNAEVARGHFLGDYMGLAYRGVTVVSAFGIADSRNHSSIYTNPVRSLAAARSSE